MHESRPNTEAFEVQPYPARGVAIAGLIALTAALFAPVEAATPDKTSQSARLTELSIEQLLDLEIYSASKFLQKTSEAPAAVTVITAADIKRFGYRSLGDVLASARGIFVTNDRNYQYLGVRGVNRPGDYNSRILLMVDGYRVNDANYDTASIGQEFFLDLDLIERVEVVRGPGSSIYGSNAFFGVVDVITKRGQALSGAELSAEAASFGGAKARFSHGQSLADGGDLLISATSQSSRGEDLHFREFDTPANNNGIAQSLDGDRAKRVFGKLSLGEFSLTGAYSERSKAVPTAAFSTVFNDPRTKTKDSQALLDIAYRGQLSEQVSVSARAYWGGYFFDAIYPYDQPPVTVNNDMSSAEWWGADLRLTGRHDDHTIIAGLEYQDNYRQDLKNHDLDPAFVYIDEKHRSLRRALYVQDEIRIARSLILNVGLRYDNYSTSGSTINPRVAVIYLPQPATAIKLLYGTAFRAPNAYELYYADATTSKASQNLKPETTASYEIVGEHQIHPNLRATASIYRNDLRNMISQITDTDGLNVFLNAAGRIRAQGAEFELEQAWSADRRLRASYARQTTRNEITGNELENSPRHLVKFNYSQPLPGDDWLAAAELHYTGQRRTLAGGSTAGFAVANLTVLSRRLAAGLEVSASVYNAFDKRYADPGRPEHVEDAIGQSGRSYRLKLNYRF